MLNAGQAYCRMLKNSVIRLTCTKLLHVYIRPFELPLKTGFTVMFTLSVHMMCIWCALGVHNFLVFLSSAVHPQ